MLPVAISRTRRRVHVQLWALFKRVFMTYWYWHVRQLNVLWPTINIDGTRIVVFPTVYKPLENEHACVEYVQKGDRVLDLGCGTGVNAVFAAAVASEVLAVDISPAALANAKENCRLQGVQNVR